MNNDLESAIDSLTETLNIFPEDLDSKLKVALIKSKF